MEMKTIAPDQIPAGKEVATLGGCCFWCLEAVYDQMVGVEQVESGYMGGRTTNPTYEEVCSGTTGHAEVVRVTFDPKTTSFREILEVLFAIHDPTTLNRQGNDAGTQYRSVIFYHTPAQLEAARALIDDLRAEQAFDDPIVTEVSAAKLFYVAEQYHQEYFERNPGQPYCMFVVAPKLQKFRKGFGAKLKK